MKTIRRHSLMLVIAFFSMLLFSTGIQSAAAADLTGKTVTDVSITGNLSVPEAEIRSAIKMKPGDKLTSEQVKQDMQSIYETGYFFDVITNFTEVPEGVKLAYTVMENPALKEIVVKGNTKVTTDKIMRMITVSTGTVLNSKKLNENARAIEQYYHDQGYILAKVSDVAMKPDGTLTITINEGMLEAIQVKGNDKTKTYVITREMKLKSGEPFNSKDAKRSMQKVYNLGYFEDVNMKLNPGKEPNSVVLETSVVEQKTGTFSIGGGYSKSDGMVGIIELGDNNFRGTGDKTKIHWEFGGKASNRNWEFGYTRPWLDSKQTSLGFNVYNMTNQYNDYDGQDLRSTYDKKRQGWDITLGRPQGEYITNYITLKNRKDQYIGPVSGVDYTGTTDQFMIDHPNYLQDNFGITHSLILARNYDSRDNIFNPTEGKRTSLSAEFAGRFLGGDFNFNKYTGEVRNYKKVGRDHVLAFRTTAGFATGKMPESGQFAIGGADTLRGYQDDAFKGNKMASATVEYRFPVAKKVHGVVFTDAGKAWDGDGFNLGGIKKSIGVGLRVDTPLGPIRLDYGKGDEGGRSHFSFGGQF